MKIEYITVPFHEVAALIASNEEKHKLEAEWEQGGHVDYRSLLSLSLRGECVAMCANLSGETVGYNVFIVSASINDIDVIDAENVGIFVEKDYRGSGVADKLIKYSEEYFFDKGVKSINYTVKTGRMEMFLEKLGYKEKYKVMVLENV